MSSPTPLDASPRFCLASEIAPRSVEWLWPARLPAGKLTILDGDPGLGKSFLALDLCARLSTGRPWPDGAPGREPAACIFLNGEDGEEDTTAPRLRALGGDPGRVTLLDGRDRDLTAPLSLPTHADALDALVARTQARLLVIDPVMAFFAASVNTASDQGIRRALAPLVALARRHACAVLLLRHLNKTGGGRALYRGLGSIGLVGVCRSAWLLAEESKGSARRVLAQQKTNLAPPPPSLAFELTQAEDGSPQVNWLGPVAVTADDLLARQRPDRGPTPRQVAMAFLEEVLAGGPLPVREISKRADEAGLAAHTVRRAKDELKVRPVRVKVDGRRISYWLLPGQEPPPPVPPESEPTDLEPWLAPLRERFPPPTPLEDI
jgi:hypothetical protein